LAEGRVAYLGAAKDAIPFFNQYVIMSWRYNYLLMFMFELDGWVQNYFFSKLVITEYVFGCNLPVHPTKAGNQHF